MPMRTPKTGAERRTRRHLRVRKKVTGTAERPRLVVFRSLKHIYAQLVDDVAGCTLAFAGTTSKGLRDAVKEDDKTAAASKVGTAIAKAAMDKGVTHIVFDRNGFDYHGRVAAVAEAARKAGLKF